jgi:hypothetical protein
MEIAPQRLSYREAVTPIKRKISTLTGRYEIPLDPPLNKGGNRSYP